MTNLNAPFGLMPIGMNGAPWSGALRTYFVPATDNTALFIGDPVIPAGSADAYGVPTATRATAAGGAYVGGVMVGVVNGPAAAGNATVPIKRENNQYRSASVATYILVADDPNQLFVIQEDSVGGALAADNVGQNADLIAGTGNTTTGLSGFQLDSNTADTTATLQLRVIELYRQPGNDIGANANWVVRINLHSLWRALGI